MPQLSQAIRRVVASYVEGHTFADIQFGTVESEHPLVIRVNEKLRLTEEFLLIAKHLTNYHMDYEMVTHEVKDFVLNGQPLRVAPGGVQRGTMLYKNRLRRGEHVILSRLSGGQMYVVVDRVGVRAWAGWPKPMLPSDSERLAELLYGDVDWRDLENLNDLIDLLDKYFRKESSLSEKEMLAAKKKLINYWESLKDSKYATGHMRGFTSTSDPIAQFFLDIGVDMPDYMNNVDGSIISWEEKERLAYYWASIREGSLTQSQFTSAARVEQLARVLYAEQTKKPYNQAECFWVMVNRIFDKSASKVDERDSQNLGNIIRAPSQFSTYYSSRNEGANGNAINPPQGDLVWNNAKLLASYAYALFGDDEARANGSVDGGLTAADLQERYAMMTDQDSVTKKEVYEYYVERLSSFPDINGVPLGTYHNRGVGFKAGENDLNVIEGTLVF